MRSPREDDIAAALKALLACRVRPTCAREPMGALRKRAVEALVPIVVRSLGVDGTNPAAIRDVRKRLSVVVAVLASTKGLGPFFRLNATCVPEALWAFFERGETTTPPSLSDAARWAAAVLASAAVEDKLPAERLRTAAEAIAHLLQTEAWLGHCLNRLPYQVLCTEHVFFATATSPKESSS